ncbi:MAG: surface protein, partial [Candidatus Paceibacteria bacterium]
MNISIKKIRVIPVLIAGLVFMYGLLAFFVVEALPADHLVTTWKTDNAGTSSSTSITIPTGSGTFNYQVDWNNDGDFTDVNTYGGGIDEATLYTGDVTFDFGSTGTYTIRIQGDFPMIYFNNGGDKLKILDVDQWGSQVWSSFVQSFWGCSNLEVNATDSPDLSSVTNLDSMFFQATSFNQDISGWDVSNVTSMLQMFYGATSFNQPLNAWGADTALVNNMANMFSGATSFNQDISGWDVSSVTNMSSMFFQATSFNQDISGWDVSSVLTMQGMFGGATAFDQPLNAWGADTALVDDMKWMFLNAISFNQDISGWDVSSVTDMSNMFQGATVFDQPLNAWGADTALVDDMNFMFREAAAFNQDISGWDVSSVASMSNMFSLATSFDQSLNAWGSDTALVNNMSNMFSGATSFDQDISSWDVASVADATSMFNSITLSTANYDSLLIGWNAQVLQSTVTFSGGNSTYCAGTS